MYTFNCQIKRQDSAFFNIFQLFDKKKDFNNRMLNILQNQVVHNYYLFILKKSIIC